MNDLILVPMILGLAAWIAGVVFVHLVKRRLRSDHLKLSKEMAPPFQQKNLSTDFAFMRFIITRNYRETGDKMLICYGNIAYVCLVAIVIGLVYFAKVIISSKG